MKKLFLLGFCCVFVLLEKGNIHATESIEIGPAGGKNKIIQLLDFGSIVFHTTQVMLTDLHNNVLYKGDVSDNITLRYHVDDIGDALNPPFVNHICIKDGLIIFSDCRCDYIYVYTVSGVLMRTLPIVDGQGVVSVTSLPRGAYIIKAKDHVVKFINP